MVFNNPLSITLFLSKELALSWFFCWFLWMISSFLYQTQSLIQSFFKLKIAGDLKYFLGLEIATSPKGINLCQHKYTKQLLTNTGFIFAKPLTLHMGSNVGLNDFDGELLQDPSQYRRFIRHLIYLTISKLDITFLSSLGQDILFPTTSFLHLSLHHALQYLKSSLGQGILFPTIPFLHLSPYADKQSTVSHSSTEVKHMALAILTTKLL
ncbi:putative mitochondrial protein, partial [Mucuna pruriens]